MSKDVVTVKVPFSSREVAVTAPQWRVCRRIENWSAVLLLLLGSGVFAGGIAVQGLAPIGIMLVLAVAYVYFDGYISRWCAGRRGRDLPPQPRA